LNALKIAFSADGLFLFGRMFRPGNQIGTMLSRREYGVMLRTTVYMLMAYKNFGDWVNR
jgi:hypothetical protein